MFGYRPRQVERYVEGIERTVTALVDQVASAQMQVRGAQGELAAREVREREILARAEQREREAQLRLEQAEAAAQQVRDDAERRAKEIIERAERAARDRAGGASAEAARLQQQAARLVDLQAAVSATLGTVVEQVNSTLQVLHEERPSELAARLAAELGESRPIRPARSAAGTPAIAAPRGAWPELGDTSLARAAASGEDLDWESEDEAPFPPVQAPGPTASRAPRGATPSDVRPPGIGAPQRQQPEPFDDPLAAVDTTIEVHGLAMYAELGALERALAHMQHVQDVYVSAYVDGHAVLQVRQSRSTPLVEQLRNELAASWDVEPHPGHGPVVIRHAETGPTGPA